MKHLLVVTILLNFPTSAVSQGVTVSPGARLGLNASCELLDTCEPRPGQVDRGARDWTIKADRNGNIRRVEATNPSACTDAVKDNLARLTAHYGARPEITVPNEEMIAAVIALAVPTSVPLIDDSLWPVAELDDERGFLADRLSTSLKRMLTLSGELDFVGNKSKITQTWDAALVAAVSLVAKSDGIGKALMLARKWPMIEEFAPYVWALRVCSRVNPGLVAIARQQLKQEDPDSVWSFTIYGDWSALVQPFRMPAASQQFASLANPFLVEPDGLANQRRDKTLFAAADVRKFKDAVALKSTELAVYVTDRKNQLATRTTSLRMRLNNEKITVKNLHAMLQLQLKIITDLENDIQKTAGLKREVGSKFVKVRAEMADAASTLLILTRERDRARDDSSASTADVQAKRKLIENADQMLKAIQLKCGGATYQECNDASAKLDYDRRNYEANFALAAVRESYLKALDHSALLTDGLFAKETAIQSHQVASSNLRQQLGALIAKDNELTKTLERVKADVEKKKEEVAPAMHTMSQLHKVEADLALLMP